MALQWTWLDKTMQGTEQPAVRPWASHFPSLSLCFHCGNEAVGLTGCLIIWGVVQRSLLTQMN